MQWWWIMQLTGTAIIFFGASVLLDLLPKARFVAPPSAIQVMKEQTSPEFVGKLNAIPSWSSASALER